MIVCNDIDVWKYIEEWRWLNNKSRTYMGEMLGMDRKRYSEKSRGYRYSPHVATRGINFIQMVADLTGESFTVRPRE